MGWKRAVQKDSKYLRFEAGVSWEGIYQGFEERPNPFYDAANPVSSATIIDYKITMNGEDKTLSSTAQTLRDQLQGLTAPCNVKIDCVQKGIKKFFVVWTEE